MKLHFNEVKPGKFFEDKSFELSAFPVTHRGSGNFGYLFREKSHRPFLAEQGRSAGRAVWPGTQTAGRRKIDRVGRWPRDSA